ncbi:hypothetical protein Glove_141g88 [Diversispora epigaea]|uniref:Uncharacterized protein n=1 Tax=Diversispora epigaea TaxID=1348612 RepID=A0A397J137_9GLOM|nr:hypothetical protein Glove_141g88 [Diversispora epigaea]
MKNVCMKNVMRRQLGIADENQRKKMHQNPKSKNYLNYVYIQVSINRYILTLYELYLLEEIKSENSLHPNLLLKSNESSTSSVNTHNIDEKTEID